MKQFEDLHILPAAPDAVLAMYQDPEFFRRRFALAGHHDVKVVEHDNDETISRVVCRFRMLADVEVPAVARKFMTPETRVPVESTDTWNLTQRTGSIHARIYKFPQGRISADLSLLPHKEGSVTRILWKIDCSIPLVGGKLAAILADDIRIKSRKDYEATREIIKDYC
jgi:hypothetical protein